MNANDLCNLSIPRKISDLTLGQYIGKQSGTWFIWADCSNCRKERWVRYVVKTQEPETKHCPNCHPTKSHLLCDLSLPRKVGDFTLGQYIRRQYATRYIWWSCIDCGKERWVKWVVRKNRPNTEYCDICYHKGDKNPFFGKHHTEETKRKISENDTGRRGQTNSPEHRAKQSISIKKAMNKPEVIARIKALPHNQKGTPEYEHKIKSLSKANTGKVRSPEVIKAWKERMDKWIEVHGPPALGHTLSPEQRAHLSKVHKGLQAKEKHPRWLGGISLEPYGPEWTLEVRNKIKERDNYTCQLCFRVEGEVTLAIHHIDYNKKHNVPTNHITLCRSCNARVNLNRDFWQIHFEALMKVRYGKRYPQIHNSPNPILQ